MYGITWLKGTDVEVELVFIKFKRYIIGSKLPASIRLHSHTMEVRPPDPVRRTRR